jgi:hypothetical protein
LVGGGIVELEGKLIGYMETIADMVRHKIERLSNLEAKLRKYATDVKAGKYSQEDIPELVIEDLEWTIEDICDEFRNCQTCPIESACEFARKGCSEAHNCEACPRLTVCLDKGTLEVRPMGEE